MFESRMQKELDMPAAALQVTAINYSGERINARRRVQSDESVTINYVVKCGADGCLDEKSKLENIDSTQMTNIIQARLNPTSRALSWHPLCHRARAREVSLSRTKRCQLENPHHAYA